MEKLTYERLVELQPGSEILEHYHVEWNGGRVGETIFKLAFKKDIPHLRGEYGGFFKVRPEDFEKNEFFLVEPGTWKRRKKCSGT